MVTLDSDEREPPNPGQLWQHFKGTEYLIVDNRICTDVSDAMFISLRKIEATHTETQDKLTLYIGNDESEIALTGSPEYIGTKFVLYKQPVRGKEPRPVWARPLDNFMEVVSSPVDKSLNQYSNCYRFTKVR